MNKSDPQALKDTVPSKTQTAEVKLEESQRARNTIWVAIILLVIGSASVLNYLYLSYLNLQANFWQLYLSLGTSFLLVVVSVLAIVFSRRDRVTLASGMLIGGFIIAVLSTSLLIPSFGLLLGLISTFIILVIANQTLPQRWVTLVIMIGILTGAGAAMVGVYAPTTPVGLPAIGPFMLWLIVVGPITFVLFLGWQFRFLSLTNKLIVAFFIVTLLIAAAMAVYTQNTTQKALTDNVGESLKSLADTQALTVGDLLEKQIDTLTSLALSEWFRLGVRAANDSYTGDEAAIQAEIDRLDQQWRAVDAADDNDDPLVLKNWMWTKMNNTFAAELYKYSQTFPDNVEVFITDRYGALVATNNRTSDYYQADEEWWQVAFNDGLGGTYIGAPEFDESADVTSVNIAIPVLDQDTGEAIGVLRTTYRMTPLEALLGSARLGETGEADILFPGDPVQHFHEGGMAAVETETLEQLQEAADVDYAGIAYEGVDSLVSMAQVRSVAGNPDIEALGWTVLVHQQTEEALAAVAAQTQTTLLLVVVIAGVVSVGAVPLAQFLTGPITRLTAVAERVREGELTAQAQVESRDEVGQLAATFNAMNAQLRETLAGLEQRVADRTRELSLAGEASRALSQMRDLDTLLVNAVDLIQFSFDLYYTQVYLTDPSGRALVLRAGSGDVGAELLRRGHRLPIGPGSINGGVAAESRPIIVSDTTTSSTFRPNPLLPDTRSEMAVPLLVGERVVGVLDLQNSRVGAFTEDSLPAFEALAGQLAIAVENATLFTQAQQARSELENQARRLTREGWREFLDAVERSERLGYMYDQGELAVYNHPVHSKDEGALGTPIIVTGEPVGTIQLEREAGQPWTSEDSELVTVVAGQVARQIENLRLLARAESYRAEAEDAAKRLTREGWESYLEELAIDELGFTYDQERVAPLAAEQPEQDNTVFARSLYAHGAVVGELALEGDKPPQEEDLQLITTVTERLSDHLENLRLSAQTQVALAETQALYSIIAEMNAAQTYEDILDALAEKTLLNRADQLLVMGIFDQPMDASQMPEWIYPVAYRADSDIEIAARYPLSAFEARPNTLFTDSPIILGDVAADPRLDKVTRTLFQQVFQAKSSIVIPMMLGDQSIGFIQGYFSDQIEFPQNEIERFVAVAGQAAIAVQSHLLLEQAQNRARQEERIREVTAQVFSAADVDTIMRRAVEQVSRVLGVPAFIYLGDGESQSANETLGEMANE